MTQYRPQYYQALLESSVTAARAILPVVLEIVPRVRSAVDVGCGAGAWLRELQERGVEEILGIDGDWVEPRQLVIPPDRLLRHDLAETLALDRRFDLAISLEVAEHLPEECADPFVASLVSLSDFVLFSAAIPFQTGKGHVNEQWPDYWAARFGDHGYVALDAIRGRIWNDPSVSVWYRQNVLLFVEDSRVQEVRARAGLHHVAPLALVHPELFLGRAEPLFYSLRLGFLLPKPLKRWIRRLVAG